MCLLPWFCRTQNSWERLCRIGNDWFLCKLSIWASSIHPEGDIKYLFLYHKCSIEIENFQVFIKNKFSFTVYFSQQISWAALQVPKDTPHLKYSATEISLQGECYKCVFPAMNSWRMLFLGQPLAKKMLTFAFTPITWDISQVVGMRLNVQ